MQHRLLTMVGILFLLAGCGSTPSSSDLASAQDSLSNGDYDSALTKAQAIIDSPTASDEDKQAAYYVKGYALLGKGNINVTSAIADMDGESIPFRRLLNLSVDLTATSASAAADAMNAAAALSPTTAFYALQATSAPTLERYRARLIANATAMVTLLTNVLEVDANGNVTPKSGYTITTALAEMYPTDGNGLLRYASVVAVTYPYCELNSSTQSKILQAINATVYISYIKGASTPGNPYIYRSADGNHTIRPTSTEAEILAAVKYELGKIF